MIQWREAVAAAEFSSPVDRVHRETDAAFQYAEVVLAQQEWLLVRETEVGQSQELHQYQTMATQTTTKSYTSPTNSYLHMACN